MFSTQDVLSSCKLKFLENGEGGMSVLCVQLTHGGISPACRDVFIMIVGILSMCCLFLCVRACVCVCVCVCLCLCVCAVCLCVCAVCVCMYVCVRTCVCVYIFQTSSFSQLWAISVSGISPNVCMYV